MDIKRYFATRLKALREEKGLNQGQLAKELGISRGSISFYENGDRIPDIEIFNTICCYFNVSCDYLLGHSDIKKSSMEISAIRDYTHLSDENIKKLHNPRVRFLRDILNDYIAAILENEKSLLNIGDYLFYRDLVVHAKEIFYAGELDKYNIPYEENEWLSNYTVSRKILKLSTAQETEYHKERLKFEHSIKYIIDKRDLLEYKISKSFFEEMLNHFYGGEYYERMSNEIKKHSLPDIVSGNIETVFQIDSRKEMFALYQEEGVTNGNSSTEG